jgi:hypothetical protein
MQTRQGSKTLAEEQRSLPAKSTHQHDGVLELLSAAAVGEGILVCERDRLALEGKERNIFQALVSRM